MINTTARFLNVRRKSTSSWWGDSLGMVKLGHSPRCASLWDICTTTRIGRQRKSRALLGSDMLVILSTKNNILCLQHDDWKLPGLKLKSRSGKAVKVEGGSEIVSW